MNDNLKLLIKKYKQGKFNSTLASNLCELNDKEIIIFLKACKAFDNRDFKRTNKLRQLWNSHAFVVHFDSLISSDLKELILLSFFSDSSFINKDFFEKLISQHPKFAIKYSRLSKSFIQEEYFNLYQNSLPTSRNIDLRILFHEFNFLYQKNKQWHQKEIENINSIQNIPVEDILIQACSFLEIYKRADFSHTNNLSHTISFRTNLLKALSYILTKVDLTNKQEHYQTLDSFHRQYISQLPPVNPAHFAAKQIYYPTEVVSEQKELLRKTFKFFMDKLSFDYMLDNYAVGFADFTYINENDGTLLQNKNFNQHRRNTKKYTYSEFLFKNKTDQLTNNSEKFYNINSALAYWEYLKLPESIIQNEGEIDIKKVLLLLHTFSSWLLPLKREIFMSPNGKLSSLRRPKVPTPTKFEKAFNRQYLNVFDLKKLCFKISSYFKWSIQETKDIIDYLSIDLLESNSGNKVDGYSHPFMKVGSKIIWLTNIFEDFKWEVHLHKRLVKDKIDHNTQTAEIERALSNDFSDADFNSVPSHKYSFMKDGGTIKGEIDTLAYKNGYLFVIEQKTTYVDEEPNHNAIYHAKTVEGKADAQLQLALQYIKNNFNEIKKIEDLKIDKEISEIKIIPLIVSNVFDYDGTKTENKILKISDITLKIILKNDWKNLMFINPDKYIDCKDKQFGNIELPIVSYDSIYNSNNSDFNFKNYTGPKTKNEANLWSTPNECSPEDLLKAINKNTVWNFVDKVWNFKPVEISITSPQ